MASHEFVKEATRASEGTKMPRAKWEFVIKIERKIPSPPNQYRIAYVLGSLDDKIDLNRKMNKTLEALARTIFQSWFVDFNPVRAKAEGRQPEGMDAATAALFPSEFEEIEGREIPKGWGIGSLSDIIDLIGGGTPQTTVEEYWNGDIPWFSVVDTPHEGDVFVIDTEKHITQSGVENSSTNILPVGTTIITARGTVGNLALVGTPMAMNQSCYGARGKAGYTDYFIHFQLRRAIADLQQQTHGTVFETITRQTFDGVKIIIPPDEIAQKFDQIVRGDLEKIRKNLLESRTLATLRDEMLPKLMSGEIPV
jgi:type I restriction enzyme S subunit